MTYRKSLIVGLFVGLSAGPTVVRAADSFAWQPPSTIGTAPAIELHGNDAAQSAASTSWQRSEQSATADIRFKRPGVASSQPAAETTEAKLNLSPASNAISTAKPSATIDVTSVAPRAIPAPAKQPAPLSALLAPALEQQAASAPPAAQIAALPTQPRAQHPAPQIATAASQQPASSSTINAAAPAAQSQPSSLPLLEESALAQSQQSAQQAAAQSAELPEVRLTDEQLQLVARILTDSNVIRAAQEEPLPSAPNADPLRRPKDDDQGAGGPEQHHGDMYYDECCPPQPRMFWVAGVEATFLSPDLNSDGASWTVEDVLEDRAESYTTEDIDSMYLSPRIWIGVQGCAWGANLRYWHLNASESAFDPSIGRDGTWDAFDCGKPNVGFFSMSRLEAYTIDFEITRRFCLHDCAMQGSVGVRHAEIDHADSITGTAISTDASLFGYAESDRYTRGTGLVFGWYGRKPLFPCSCVHWYYNLRWSALWGPTRTAVETGATVLATGANAGSVNGAYTCVDDNLFIGEVQLGLEWNYALQCVPANAFFRAGVEYQRWSGGMGYSEAGSFAGIEVNNTFEQVGSTFASAAAPELDLIGLTLGTGLTW